jgi:hypothetical protein
MESSVGVMTEAPPQTALTTLMPSMEMPLALFWPPLALAWGRFSVGAAPPLPEPPGPWLPGVA